MYTFISPLCPSVCLSVYRQLSTQELLELRRQLRCLRKFSVKLQKRHIDHPNWTLAAKVLRQHMCTVPQLGSTSLDFYVYCIYRMYRYIYVILCAELLLYKPRWKFYTSFWLQQQVLGSLIQPLCLSVDNFQLRNYQSLLELPLGRYRRDEFKPVQIIQIG